MDSNNNRRMIAYYRVSSQGQEDNTSLANQQKKIRAYCKINDIKLVKEYTEVETASGKAVRVEFDAALKQMITDKTIDGMIVYDIDRYFRNCGEGLKTFEKYFKDSGSQLVSIRQNFDTSTDEGWMALGMFLLFAEYELRKIRFRTRAGVDAVRAAGHFGGGKVPFGYRSEYDEATARFNLIPHEQEYQWIQQMKEWKQQGMSYCGIARQLNERAVLGKGGGVIKWESKGVARILQANDYRTDYRNDYRNDYRTATPEELEEETARFKRAAQNKI